MKLYCQNYSADFPRVLILIPRLDQYQRTVTKPERTDCMPEIINLINKVFRIFQNYNPVRHSSTYLSREGGREGEG